MARSVDLSRFSMVPANHVPRSAFDISHTHKTTFDSAWLVPVLVQEVLPGDSMRLKMDAFARLTTPIVPIMDNIYLESFFFFVPYRLLWEHWENFMGDKATPATTTEYLTPVLPVAAGHTTVGSIADYFGITFADDSGSVDVSAFPFRAYNLVWNEWFRDPVLQDPIYCPTDDGPDTLLTNYQLRPRGKRHDYFTSARPWPSAPLNLTAFQSSSQNPLGPGANFTFPSRIGAPVSGIGMDSSSVAVAGPATVNTPGGRNAVFQNIFSDTAHTIYIEAGGTLGGAATAYPDIRVLIDDIRTANMMKVMMERQARGGQRYVEIVRSEFGVTPPDFRLQRPEYLGGGRSAVHLNPVAQTSATRTGDAAETTVLGELAATGTAIMSNHGFSSSFTEHGVVLGLVNARADLTYQQGVERFWFRRTRFDFYTPGLAHLGEQAIISREIYLDGSGSNTGQGATVTGDFSVFGYVPRWEEYRYKPSRISGRFRSQALNTLHQWHLAQEFGERPVLNSAFIEEDPPLDRVLALGGHVHEQFYFDSFFQIRMTRPLPMFSVPHMGPRL